ncbi:hypothetical protein ACQHGV_13360 [Sphingomonas pseudosanguinis]|uniref:hypothetical protein n=1 Tax=Sphingomonas pseudosanguinis TaxID=413712 RepID=UPI003F8734F2
MPASGAKTVHFREIGFPGDQRGDNAAIYTTHQRNPVDRAIAQKGVGFLVFHDGLDGSLSNWRPAFDQLLAYLDANRALIDVVTVEDLETP